MGLIHSTTFNVCSDNHKAALAFAELLRSKGFQTEILEQSPEALAHAEEQGQSSPPAAVAHNAPADVAVAASIEIEENHTEGAGDAEPRSRRSRRNETSE